jgi:hypothetical protein
VGISRSHHSKAPTDNPNAFFKLETAGTTYGTPKSVPEVLASGPMREQLMGNPRLMGNMDPSATTRKGRTGGSQGEGHGHHPTGPEMGHGGHK